MNKNTIKSECIVCSLKKIEHCHQVCKTCIIKSGKEECPVCRKFVNLSEHEKRKCKQYQKKMLFDTFRENNPHLSTLNNSDKLIEEIIQSITLNLN